MYLRKSTDERDKQVRSLSDQRSELEELASKNNLHVAAILEEKQTAKVPGRPIFNAMLDRLKNGEADGILAWHPDRLARNSVDGGQIIHLVDQGVIEDLVFVSHWFEPTPQGKFILSMAFGQSKYYVDNLSESIKRSYRQKLAAGLWPVGAPTGYLHDRATGGIKPDPQYAPIVRRMFERYAVGDVTTIHLHDLAVRWGLHSNRGNIPHGSFTDRLLKNPIYHGLMVFNGEVYPGVHEPLVSKALFDKVQRALEARSHYRRPNDAHAVHPFRGMFSCGECGGSITMERQKGHIYLRCTKKRVRCSQSYVREEVLTEQMRAAVRSLSLPPQFARKILDRHTKSTRLTQDPGHLQDELDQIDERLRKLSERYLDDEFSPEEYRDIKNPLIRHRASIREKFEQARIAYLNPHLSARTFLDEAIQVFSTANSGNLADLCRFLRTVGSNHQIRDKQYTFSPLGAWKTVALYGPNRNGDFLRDRVSDEIEGDFLISAATSWLLEDVRYGSGGRPAVPVSSPGEIRTTPAGVL